MSRLTEELDRAGNAPASAKTGTGGMVVTSHPRAVEAGVRALERGGTAVDAAVAAAAVLTVVDPMSTSIGGDCFALYSEPGKEVQALNGSGRAPRAASLEDLRRRGHVSVPERGILSVTVPGALSAWDELLKAGGKFSLAEALEPAIAISKEGFEVTEVVGRDWKASEDFLRDSPGGEAWLVAGKAPEVGARFSQPELADTLAQVAESGVQAFYSGQLAQKIAKVSSELNGWLALPDLMSHESSWVKPLVGHYRGHPVYELPPNGQGLVPLLALGILEDWPLADLPDAERTHLMVEAIKVAFDDAREWIGDPARMHIDPQELLGEDYVAPRRDSILSYAQGNRRSSAPAADTVYVAAVDQDGGACSLINSTFMHFGSGVVVPETGIILQNRGHLFSTDPMHPNALGAGRRPYHTIIPAMAFRQGVPWLVFGVVGGFQQPQAQVQILSRIIDQGMGYDEAIQAPRFRWETENRVRLERGTTEEVIEGLKERGHMVVEGEHGFGGAQLIAIERGALYGSSDSRKDGCVGTAARREQDDNDS